MYRSRAGGTPLIRTRWKAGRETDAPGPFAVSATRFHYRSPLHLAGVGVHALRLRRGWGSRPGAVGLLTGSEPFRAITWSLSVWTGEEHLRAFLRAPEHLELMRRYRPRLVTVSSVLWQTEDLRPAELWRQGLERLG